MSLILTWIELGIFSELSGVRILLLPNYNLTCLDLTKKLLKWKMASECCLIFIFWLKWYNTSVEEFTVVTDNIGSINRVPKKRMYCLHIQFWPCARSTWLGIKKKVFCPQYPVMLTLRMVKIAKRTSRPQKDIFIQIKENLVLKKQWEQSSGDRQTHHASTHSSLSEHRILLHFATFLQSQSFYKSKIC